jgi:hypothetical protein
MKKLFVIAALVAAIGLVSAGCGKKEEKTPGKPVPADTTPKAPDKK